MKKNFNVNVDTDTSADADSDANSDADVMHKLFWPLFRVAKNIQSPVFQ